MEIDLYENGSQEDKPKKIMSIAKAIAFVLIGLVAVFLIFHGLKWFWNTGLAELIMCSICLAILYLFTKHFVPSLIVSVVALFVMHLMGYGLKPPVQLGFRNSKIGIGQVLQVQNTSSRELQCSMWVTNKVALQSTTYDFALNPNELKEIGMRECDWHFDIGERGSISAEKHLFFRRFNVK
ncbi:hypothetical protein P4B35_21270 [Pontiellaceae bacterium B12227]|nr:hypothetical protein [Pontiellaceae bacterium B12227]